MKRRFLLQHLFSFLMPAFIPLLIFSLVVSVIAFQYTRQEVDRTSSVALEQSQTSLEHLFQSAGRIGADISSSSALPLIMKNLLQHKTVAYENYNNYMIIQSYLQMQIGLEPTIASVYVYINNPHEQFFVSNGSLYSTASFYDVGWFDTYRACQNRLDSYYELRTVQSGFSQGTQSTYITLYYNLYYPGRVVSDGVIVVNLRVDAVQKILNTLSGRPQSAFIITEHDGSVLCASGNAAAVLHADAMPAALDLLELARGYMLSSASSSVFPWRYCLITPYAYAYRMPRAVVCIMLAFLAGSLLLAFILAYISSSRLSRSLSRIMEILEQSKTDHPAPVPPNAPRNSYDYIIQNLWEMFMKQNYLKVQLSEKHYRLQVMELLALQSQINPHFLYNTLQTIYLQALSFTGKPNQVNDMLEHLMVILRYSLSCPTNMSSLAEDLRCVRSYVYLEQRQYGPQLCVHWNIDDGLETIAIPKLIIQPLVENSIRHGMRGEETPLQIDVTLQKTDDGLRIVVTDNGRGVSEEQCKKVCGKLHMALSGQAQDVDTEHIGLYNTAKRLYLKYPNRCHMSFSSVESKGTEVVIVIPDGAA